MSDLLITGARILGGAESDVLVRGGTIAEIAPRPGVLDAPAGADVVDAAGLALLPGFVDLHTHLREPGREDTETVATGSAAAAAGGFTAVLAMANTSPVTDTAEAALHILDLGRTAGLVDVQPVGAVTKSLLGEELAELGLMARSRARVRVFSDDGRCVSDARVMRRALEYLRAFGGVISQHSQDPHLADSAACCHEGEVSGRLGLPGWPAPAESSVIARDAMLAQHTGSRVHVAHVTTAEGVEVVRWAKSRGIAMTAEVTPHHLALDVGRLNGYDPTFKVNPPLRPHEDIEALRAALADGTIDAVATDHAPHGRHDKEHAFVDAAFGVLGLETAFSVVHDVMVSSGRMTLTDLADRMSLAPARIAGLAGHGREVEVGAPANLVLVDPSATVDVDRDTSHSLSRTPPGRAPPLPGPPHPPPGGGGRPPGAAGGGARAGPRPGRLGRGGFAVSAVLVLEDGRTFVGEAYGAVGETVGEAVFSTGMTGYQETLTDPSYHRQIVVMTAPHIGNTGWTEEDDESSRVWVAGFVVRDPALRPSSWRSRSSLEERLSAQDVVGISGIDTRALTRHLRERGAMRAGIFSGDAAGMPLPALLEKVTSAPTMTGARLAEQVTTSQPYVVPAEGEGRFTVAVVDLGLKAMTTERMTARGIDVHVLPASASIEDVLAVQPDGVFFSNGPGDPQTAEPQVELLQEVLRREIPYFGICFGNQLLGRALGFGTYKLKYGHRGINQPVMDRRTGKVEITSHNHGFAVEAPPEAWDAGAATELGSVTVSHVCLNDDVVEGLEVRDDDGRLTAFSVQYHPEAASGPHDASHLFDRFVEVLWERRATHTGSAAKGAGG